MNCKGNQMAYIKGANPKHGGQHNGRFVFITTLHDKDKWNYEGALLDDNGRRYPWIHDAVLRPIGNPDEDAVDETLTWKCGKPPVVDVDAIKKAKQKEKVDV